jgi:hypothetical protein
MTLDRLIARQKLHSAQSEGWDSTLAKLKATDQFRSIERIA